MGAFDDDDKEFTHPSYGMARFSRQSGGSYSLFGSSVEHNNTIVLTVSTGHRRRGIHNDWYRDDKILVEIRMSPVQFAELISTFNCGSGIPCTLEIAEGKRVPRCPDEHKRNEFEQEFADDISKVVADAKAIAASVNGILKKKSLTIDDREKVAKALQQLIQHIEKNMPFVLTCFNEQVEKTVVEAKAEIDAAMTNMIVRLGHEKLAEMIGSGPQVRQLDRIEGVVSGERPAGKVT